MENIQIKHTSGVNFTNVDSSVFNIPKNH